MWRKCTRVKRSPSTCHTILSNRANRTKRPRWIETVQAEEVHIDCSTKNKLRTRWIKSMQDFRAALRLRTLPHCHSKVGEPWQAEGPLVVILERKHQSRVSQRTFNPRLVEEQREPWVNDVCERGLRYPKVNSTPGATNSPGKEEQREKLAC